MAFITSIPHDLNTITYLFKSDRTREERNNLIFASCKMFSRVLLIAGVAASVKSLSVSDISGKLSLVVSAVASFILSHDLYLITSNFENNKIIDATISYAAKMQKDISDKFAKEIKQTQGLFKKLKTLRKNWKDLRDNKIPRLDEKDIVNHLAKTMTDGSLLPIWYQARHHWFKKVVSALYD